MRQTFALATARMRPVVTRCTDITVALGVVVASFAAALARRSPGVCESNPLLVNICAGVHRTAARGRQWPPRSSAHRI
jgi:hypothetical protein